MTHDITLDEAIEHAKQVARTCNDDQCAVEHIQLAEWLRTARGAEAAGRWHTAKLEKMLEQADAENAKLRNAYGSMSREHSQTIVELSDAHYSIDQLNAENAKLREQIHWLKQGDILHVLTDQEYIDQCERERLMQVSIDALDKENAKLREMLAEDNEELAKARRVIDYLYFFVKSCGVDAEDMRELGVEVSE